MRIFTNRACCTRPNSSKLTGDEQMLPYEFQMESRVRENFMHGSTGEMKLLKNNVLRLRRFTLIELLIVIAIIAILAGMLLPSLNTARNRAKAISCVNNMKQLGVGIIQYVNDHDGIIPMLDYNTGSHRWTVALIGNMENNTVKGDYIPISVLECPAMVRNADMTGTVTSGNAWEQSGWWKAFPAYGMSWAFQTRTSFARARISNWKNPSQKLFIADTAWNQTDGSANFNIGFYRWLSSSTAMSGLSWGRPAARHLRSVNVLYGDCSVSAYQVPNIHNPYISTVFDQYVNDNLKYLDPLK